MKRTVAKIVFVVTLWAATVAICHEIDQLAHSWWTAGLGGGFGYIVALGGVKLFNRVWPKPADGWAE